MNQTNQKQQDKKDKTQLVWVVLGIISVVLLLGLRNEIKGVFDDGFNLSLKDIFHYDKNKEI